MPNCGRIINGNNNNWTNFNDREDEEVNTGSTMTKGEAQEIITTCQTMNYAHYIYSQKDYEEALRIIGDE